MKLLYEGVDNMAKYTVEMNGHTMEYPRLTHQETMQKINEYQLYHDKMLKDELVLSNLKLVLSLVQKYQARTENLDDLFQVGIIGLIKSIENFDTSLNVRFSTYAVPLIIGEMKRYLRDDSSLHIPRSMRDLAYKAMQQNDIYMKEKNKEATPLELSHLLKVDEGLVVEALSSTRSVASLSQDIQGDEQGQVEMVSQVPHPRNDFYHLHHHLDLQNAIHYLDDKEKSIIYKRYYQDHTQSEIAEELFISQAQVSRLEKQALEHLKKYMSS